MRNNKLKIGIAHPRLGWGGSEKRVLWGIEALKKDYEVTLITAGNFRLEELNRYYGTSLHPNDFEVRQAPLPFFLRNNAKAAALRGSIYQRFCRRVASDFDVLISAYGPCDFGVPAIHFIPDFSWDNKIRKKLHPIPPGLIYRDNLLRKMYLFFSRAFANFSGRDLFGGEDLMIAVSPWVANLMRDKYGIECKVLFSPVVGDFTSFPHKERESGFVCLGRIAPEKRIERSIEILSKVRQKGHDLHLHIIGGLDNTPYSKFINSLVLNNSTWLMCEGRLFLKDKIEILSKHYFGLHACQGDAFPGAVAEMVKAGCIVFAPKEGGQAEIINHPSLLYGSTEEAVEKIDAVLRDPAIQADLRNHLKKQGAKFSTSKFMDGLRAAVEKFLEEKSTLRKAA